jgi:hypothetical protein
MLFVACCFSQCVVTFEQFTAYDNNYKYFLLKSYFTIIHFIPGINHQT